MMHPMRQHFRHQSDIGIRGIGQSLDEAFEEGAAALMKVIAAPEQIAPVQAVEIECEAEANDLLFFDWINALIYEMDVRKMLFSAFEVRIQGGRLKACARGERVDPDTHDIAVEVKAATFMQLNVYRNPDNHWVAQCVVDV